MDRTVVAFALGAAVALVGVVVVEIAWHVGRLPDASASAQQLPLAHYETPAATVHSGKPNFRAVTFATSSDNKTTSGVWMADGPSTFEWSYSDDEAVYIHEGQVHVEYQGRKFSLNPGETAFFQAGTKAMWTVPQQVRKSWTIHETSRLTKLWRKLTGASAPA